MWIVLSQLNNIIMLGNIDFKRYCDGFTSFSEKTLFVSATKDLTPNFIKLKICIHNVNK